MDILEFRPLVIFLIEIGLAYYVFRYGVKFKNMIALFLVFLSGYQLGEFIILQSSESGIGYQIAFFSTTLLPPFGIFLIERVEKKFYGGIIALGASFFFAVGFLINPDALQLVEKCACFAKFAPKDSMSTFITAWGIYYVSALTYAMLLALYLHFKETANLRKLVLLNIFFAYVFFFPLSYVLIVVFNMDISYIISVMCSLGLIGGIGIYRLGMGIGYKQPAKKKKAEKFKVKNKK